MMMTSACGSLSRSVTWLSRTAQADITDMYGVSHHHSMQKRMDESRDERSQTGRILYSGIDINNLEDS